VAHSSLLFVKFHDMLSKMFRDMLSNSAAVGREGKWETRRVFHGSNPAYIKPLDQTTLKLKNVHHHLIDKQLALKVMHNLVHFDDDLSIGTDGESHRLDVRIDNRPLTRPVAAHAIPSMNVAAFHPVGPRDVFPHGRKHGFYIPGIKSGIYAIEKRNLVRHSRFSEPRCQGRKPKQSRNPFIPKLNLARKLGHQLSPTQK
jgi:hypothetical protein